MKRIFAVLIIATSFMTVSALQNAGAFMPDVNGEYVVYRDNTWKGGAYTGFLYYNDNAYALMLKTPSEKTVLLISTEKKNGTLTITGVKPLEGGSGENGTYNTNYLMELFQTFVSTRARIDASLFPQPVTGTADIGMLGGLVSIRYQYYIPIFNIEQVTAAEHNNSISLEAVRIGRLVSNDDTSFFNFEAAAWDKDAEAKYNGITLEAAAKEIPVTCDGITVSLDTQWAAADDNTYFLNNDKHNAAMITIRGIDGTAAGITNLYDFVRLFTRSTNGLSYNPQAMSITMSDNPSGGKTLIIANTAIDTVNKIRNQSFALVSQGSGDNSGAYALVTMSVIEPVYRNNQPYFERIIPRP